MNWLGCSVQGVPQLSCLPLLFSTIIYYAFIFAGLVALVLIIWAGIKYIRSGGDQKQVQGARQTLTYAIIGLVLILGSVLIINFISYITDVECISKFGFNTCSSESTNNQSSTSPYEGMYGCFDSLTGGAPGCFIYSPNNDPATPRGNQWYRSYGACSNACNPPTTDPRGSGPR